VIQSIFHLLDLRVFFCFLFRFFVLFLPPDDGILLIGRGGADGSVVAAVAEGSGTGTATATATGISSCPEAAAAFENGLRDFSFSMVPESVGRAIAGTAENTDDDCDSGATLASTNVGGGNIISFVVSAIVAYVKTNEVIPMKTYDNIGMWSVFMLKL
jgi:hypothetical protein